MFDRTFLSKAQLEFVVVSDTHYMLDPGERAVEFESRRRQSARAERALGLIGSLQADFVVHMGDLAQEYPETPRFKQAMAEVHAQLERTGVKPYHVAGNQDIGDKPDPTMPTNWVTPESLASFHDRFGNSWYSWDRAGVHFIVLNSQLLNTDLPEREQQRAWLESDLPAHADRRIIIFQHMAPFLQHEQEPSLGHYDNIPEPDRGWLLGLLRQYRVELIFTAHSHFAFFNRIDQTRHYGTVSTSFTRPGFSQLFSSGPPPEQGRDDAQKLGFYLLRVFEKGTSVHFIRTYGDTTPVDKTAPTHFLISGTSRDLPHSPLGVTLRHPLAQITEVPIAWPSIIRQPVRNDYPLLSCTELGLRQVRVPATDLADPLQSERLGYLRDEGLQVVATWLWTPELDLVRAVASHQHQLDGIELQLLGSLWPDEDCCQQIKRCATDVELPVLLTPVIPNEQVPGKQHLRTRFGYRPEELEELNGRLAQSETQIDRVLCRVDPGLSPWETMGQQPDLPALSHLGAIDWAVEFATTDERGQVVRAAEAILAISCLPQARLFLEPLVDLDRTMDITYGLLDRRCNPRPVFNVVRCLNTILFSSPETRARVITPSIDGARVMGVAGADTVLWLLLPSQAEKCRLELRPLDDHFKKKPTGLTCYHLEQGTSQAVSFNQEQNNFSFDFDEASLLIFRK